MTTSRATEHDDDSEETALQASTTTDRSRRLLVFWPEGYLSVGLPKEGAVVIGRSTKADVRVNHVSMSRLHARVEVVGDTVTIEDMESANGTSVGGVKLKPKERVRLLPGTSASMGQAMVIIELPGAPAEQSREA